ncbi:hypothetical protein AMTR_s00055p00116520 [Amborella trichopoda]|uniref:Uncharacterized protein n=1 Tax=Amborella trichopoda TaxID=13333 RepID=U5CY28_AMBTC|nr:hypothetical protein AMTR_s00055p00116520 [Amborella trichopoda]
MLSPAVHLHVLTLRPSRSGIQASRAITLRQSICSLWQRTFMLRHYVIHVLKVKLWDPHRSGRPHVRSGGPPSRSGSRFFTLRQSSFWSHSAPEAHMFAPAIHLHALALLT